MALGTFRVNDEDWKAFKQLCKDSGSTASAEIVAYIKSCNKSEKVGVVAAKETRIDSVEMGELLSLTSLDVRIDKLEALIDSRIERAAQERVSMRGDISVLLSEVNTLIEAEDRSPLELTQAINQID